MLSRLHKCNHFLLAGILALGWTFLACDSASAQGCVNARQTVPVFGLQTINRGDEATPRNEPWLSGNRFVFSVDYRYLHSHRHFVGTEEQHQRAELGTEVNNKVHLLNFAGTYDISPRFNVTLSVPVFIASRWNQRTPEQVSHASGIGDITVMGRMWLIRPPSESHQNVSFGLGLKLPTGRSGVTDTVNTPTGPQTRVVDQSIQPGDGGYGMVLDFQAYKSVHFARLYASGLYLVNPRNTNGVQTGRSRPSEAIMSVADQYVYRAGAVLPVPKVQSMAWSLGIRGEGVPSTDLIGKSDGFRRPGYVISVEPGIIVSKGTNSWYLNVPIPVRRNRTRSVADIKDNRHGDAAFGDYLILAGFSRRF